MSYYRDQDWDQGYSTSYKRFDTSGIPVETYAGTQYTRFRKTTGFRNRPKNDNSVWVADYLADPYASFLSEDRDPYLENLKARGLQGFTRGPDNGHTLDSLKTVCTFTHGDVRMIRTNGLKNVYQEWNNVAVTPYWPSSMSDGGPFSQPFPWSEPSDWGFDNLNNFAQRAIKYTAPDPSQLNVARMLGELAIAGIPSYLGIKAFDGRAKDILRQSGSDYLNWKFGWEPLIGDVLKAAEVLRRSSEALSRLPQEGRAVRRTWSLPQSMSLWDNSSTSAPVLRYGPMEPSFYEGLQRNKPPTWDASVTSRPISGASRVSKMLQKRQWFTGSYTAFLPLGFDPSSYLERLDVLTKVKLTPQVLWQLSPWTWLTDWALHIGDSIAANEVALNKLIHIHYAYAMEESVATTFMDVNVTGTTASNQVYEGPQKWSHVTRTTRKRRIRANPYGFTAGSLGELTPSQIAIIVALGLSKS